MRIAFQDGSKMPGYSRNVNGRGVIEVMASEKLQRFIEPPRAVDFAEHLSCTFPFCQAGISLITCDINGDFYPCGLAPEDDKSQVKLGNYLSFSDEHYFAVLERLHRRDEKYRLECSDCEANIICSFGCTIDRSSAPSEMEAECRATRMLFREFKKIRISRIIDVVSTVKQRLGHVLGCGQIFLVDRSHKRKSRQAKRSSFKIGNS